MQTDFSKSAKFVSEREINHQSEFKHTFIRISSSSIDFLFSYKMTSNPEEITLASIPPTQIDIPGLITRPPRQPYKTIVFSGGGVRGFAIAGAIKYLANVGLIDKITTRKFIGTSVGSLIGFLLALRYDVIDIVDFMRRFPLKSIENLDIDCFTRLITEHGLEHGDKFITYIRGICEHRTGNPDITFKQLTEKYNSELVCIGSNLAVAYGATTFDIHTTPDLPVWQAIRISCGIPLFFTPVIDISGGVWVDGGVTNNYAMDIVSREELVDTIGILLMRNSTDSIICTKDEITGHVQTTYNIADYMRKVMTEAIA